MNTELAERDERTIAIENAGYRWSYLVLSYGLLGIVAIRAFARGESPWDLLALVVLGGVVNAVYQSRERVLARRWMLVTAITLLLAGLVAAGMVFLRGPS